MEHTAITVSAAAWKADTLEAELYHGLAPKRKGIPLAENGLAISTGTDLQTMKPEVASGQSRRFYSKRKDKKYGNESRFLCWGW